MFSSIFSRRKSTNLETVLKGFYTDTLLLLGIGELDKKLIDILKPNDIIIGVTEGVKVSLSNSNAKVYRIPSKSPNKVELLENLIALSRDGVVKVEGKFFEGITLSLSEETLSVPYCWIFVKPTKVYNVINTRLEELGFKRVVDLGEVKILFKQL